MFTIGNVVCLHSGGPLMTVTQVSATGYGEVSVNWFDLKGRMQAANIPPDCIFRVQKTEATIVDLSEQQVQ